MSGPSEPLKITPDGDYPKPLKMFGDRDEKLATDPAFNGDGGERANPNGRAPAEPMRHSTDVGQGEGIPREGPHEPPRPVPAQK